MCQVRMLLLCVAVSKCEHASATNSKSKWNYEKPTCRQLLPCELEILHIERTHINIIVVAAAATTATALTTSNFGCPCFDCCYCCHRRYYHLLLVISKKKKRKNRGKKTLFIRWLALLRFVFIVIHCSRGVDGFFQCLTNMKSQLISPAEIIRLHDYYSRKYILRLFTKIFPTYHVTSANISRTNCAEILVY